MDWTRLRKKDTELIMRIAKRGIKMGKRFDRHLDTLGLAIDIANVHLNTGIRLEALLNQSDVQFSHDIVGMLQNIDRKTGKLKNNFKMYCR